jgi:hypothetical protein
LQGVDNIGSSSGKGGQDTEGFYMDSRINRRFICKYITKIVLLEHLKRDSA